MTLASSQPQNMIKDQMIADRRMTRMEKTISRSQALVVNGGALPTTVYDGMEVDYIVDDDLTNVMWRLKYIESQPAPYKWMFCGGTPILQGDTGVPWHDLNTVPDGTWQSFYANDPVISIPLAGDYQVDFRANFQFRSAASSGYKWIEFQGRLAYGPGTANIRDESATRELYAVWEQDFADTASGFGGFGATASRQFRKDAIPAGHTIRPHWRMNNMQAGSAWMVTSSISVTPIRVG